MDMYATKMKEFTADELDHVTGAKGEIVSFRFYNMDFAFGGGIAVVKDHATGTVNVCQANGCQKIN